MSPSRAKSLVAAASFLAALGLGAFLALRANGLLGASWTDGARSFGAETGPLVRHAVWDRPEAFAELGVARDPALAPDGRWLVFASGERGLNVELYAADMVDGRPGAVRVLGELASPADELAPAFAADALYFASDRPGGAGGLDLWRAPYANGVFGPPEPLPPGLNSAADETDPAPLGDGLALAFASNRARADFDLYRAEPDAQGFFAVEPLATLNTPTEERGPAWSGEGQSLYFSSDRGGGAADLYRSLAAERGFGPAHVVQELSDAGAAEAAPAPSADGFTLLFARETPDGASTLFGARSLELFRVPPPAVTLAQWLTLAALVLLGVLALLAKRWRALDILYKCLLVSLLLHLLLMYGLRRVFPDETSYETGRDQGPSFRVRLAPSVPTESSEGLTGPMAPRREAFQAEAARLEAAAAALEAPPRAADPAPAAEVALARQGAPEAAVELAAPREAEQRYQAAPPSLALSAPASVARESAPAAPPERQAAAPLERAPLEPARSASSAREASVDAEGPGLARAQFEPDARAVPAAELAAPTESFARADREAPPLVLEPSPARALAPPSARRPARESAEPIPLTTGRPSPSPAPATAASASDAGAEDQPARTALRAEESRTDSALQPDPPLRAPAGAEPAPVRTAAVFDATSGLGSAPEAPPAPRAPGVPQRVSAIGAAREEAALAPGPVAVPSAHTDVPEAPERASPARTSDEPSLAHATDLRGPAVEPPAGAAPAASPRFDPIAALAPAAGPARRELAPPTRETAAPARLAPAAPAPPRVEAPAMSALAERVEAPARLFETPYRNRFGAQKLRALEEHGGSAETEHAVAAGLAYLARIQRETGAWGERSDAHEKYLDVRIGKSALALLAFLGAGHVPDGDTEHAAVAGRAVEYLLGAQDERTGHFGQSCSYGHGIATYALAECFALSADERLRAPLERALAEILRHQSRVEDPRFLGGWGYYYADGRVWNGDEWPRVSVTAWQVMALESARLGGLAVPDQAFAGARAFLLGAWDPRARAFRYDHDPARLSSGYPILPASTPAALFALALLDVDPASDELAAARRFVLTRAPDGYRYTGDDDFVQRARGNPYFWYYATLALFRVGGNEWERWNQALQETLLPAQESDGSWRPLDTYAEYAGDEDDERTYATAMCVLSLEVYYRYFTPLLRVR